MESALTFNEAGRAVVAAQALRDAGFSVLWDPMHPEIVMTNASRWKAREIILSNPGVDCEWWKREKIDSDVVHRDS